MLLRSRPVQYTITGVATTYYTTGYKARLIDVKKTTCPLDYKPLTIVQLRYHQPVLFMNSVVVVVFTLKPVLTSIQYLLFLTLQGKETNFRGHKLTQN